MRATREALFVLLAFALTSVAFAAAFDYWMWGYPFARPSLHHEVRGMTALDSVTPVSTGTWGTPDGILEYVLSQYRRTDPYEDPYYFLEVRSLFAAKAAGFDPTAASRNQRTANELLTRFAKSSMTARSAEDYNSNKDLRGIVVAFRNQANQPRTLLALRGGQVSNDHYPYYEVLLDGTDPSAFRVLHSQMFYYDVAGMEGMEWPALLVPAMIPAGLLVLVGFGIRAASGRRRVPIG